MQILDSDQYALPGTNKRFVHLATVGRNTREFIYFIDRITNERYIEEITGGHLEFIEKESLAKEIEDFLVQRLNLDKILVT